MFNINLINNLYQKSRWNSQLFWLVVFILLPLRNIINFILFFAKAKRRKEFYPNGENRYFIYTP